MSTVLKLRLLFSILLICTLGRTAAQATSLVYPLGLGPSEIVQGVYPGTDSGSCCWLSKNASFRIQLPAGTDTLILRIFIPRYALLDDQRQSINARIGSTSQTACCLDSGLHEVAFRIRNNNLQSVTIALRMSQAFIPALIGQGTDRRSLTVLLTAVELRNTLAGSLSGIQVSALQPWQLVLFCLLLVLVIASTYARSIFAILWMLATDPFALYVNLGSTSLTLPKVVLIGAIIGLILNARTRLRRPGRATCVFLLAQLLLLVVMIIAASHSQYKGPGLREVLKALQYFLTFCVAYVAFRAEPNERYIGWTVALVTLAVCVLAGLQEFTGAPMSVFILQHSVPRIAGPLEGPNQLGGFLGIALPVLFARALNSRARYFQLGVVTFGCIIAAVTFSRGTIFGLLVSASVLFVFFYKPQWKARFFFGLGFLFVALFSLATVQFANGSAAPIQSRIFGTSNSGGFNGGLGTRADLWHGAYLLWRESPIIGIGPGNYELRISQVGDPGVRTHANSIYFQYLAETGLLGFGALILILALPMWTFARARKHEFAIGLLAAIIGMSLHQLVDYVLFYPKVGVIWWALIGAGYAAVEGSRHSRVTGSGPSKAAPLADG